MTSCNDDPTHCSTEYATQPRVMLVVDQLGMICRSQQSDEVMGPTAGNSNHGLCEGRMRNFLLVIHSNHWHISYHFQDIQQFRLENANFCYQPCVECPCRGCYYWDVVMPIGLKKTRLMALPFGRKSLMICTFI